MSSQQFFEREIDLVEDPTGKFAMSKVDFSNLSKGPFSNPQAIGFTTSSECLNQLEMNKTRIMDIINKVK